MNMLRAAAAALLLAAAFAQQTPAGPAKTQAPNRIRIVPQTADSFMLDIEESADGSRLLTHDRGYSPRLWDAKRQILLCVLSGHPDEVRKVRFSPDGKLVLTLSFRELRIWDAARAKLLQSVFPQDEDSFIDAAFSPDGTRVALGLYSGDLLALTTDNLTMGWRAKASDKWVWSVAYAPDGRHVLAGTEDGRAVLWDTNLTETKQVAKHAAPVHYTSFSADSKYAVSTGFDSKAHLISVADQKLVATYDQAIGDRSVTNVEIGALFIGLNGSQLVTCAANGDMPVYERGQTKPSFVLKGHTDKVREIRKSRSGKYLATYGDDNQLKLWDVAAKGELPFDRQPGSPTAGEFSPLEDVWWLGYMNGEIYRHDVKSGKVNRSTFGAVTRTSEGGYSDETGRLWLKGAVTGRSGDPGAGRQQFLFLSPEAGGKALNRNFSSQHLSPDGRFLAGTRHAGGAGFELYDLSQHRTILDMNQHARVAFSPDSTKAVLLLGAGKARIVECATGKTLSEHQLPVDKELGEISAPAWHPDGLHIVTCWHPGNAVRLWNAETGALVKQLGPVKELVHKQIITPDGKRLIMGGWESVRVIDLESGLEMWSAKIEDGDARVSDDGRRVGIVSNKSSKVYAIENGKVLFEWKTDRFRYATPDFNGFNHDMTQAIVSVGNNSYVFDVRSNKIILGMKHEGEVEAVRYAQDDSRIVTFDAIGGAHVWSTDPSVATNQWAKKLASVVVMNDGNWLVYDEQGRYDASDPSNVDGAWFVMEWEGGLEPIAMPQLKAQFYEPNLLAKALGKDKELARDVPDLSTLKLYPEVKLTRTAKGVDVQLTERDGGGIGRLAVFLNGKQVKTDRNKPYVQLDLSQFGAYMLPETRLAPDQGNLLSVTVTNEEGDLSSAPTVLDVGVPKELKAPDVRLFVLAVGVGNYAGNAADLEAPPNDAKAVARAVTDVSSRLLPGRSQVTVLTTDESDANQRPTRSRILKWFEDVAAGSTSSDIVLVFMAGHGMSKLGESSGYFFLTSEADPGNMTPASAGSSTISADDLRAALGKVPANKQVLILDTCHSGAAADTVLGAGRSVSGEYQRAWESIRDTTGTWMLAGSAADQRSYESPNVDHGLLTYSLLEAIDRGSAQGLRETPSGELFVDVERWMLYAANRVDSLRAEVGLGGIQRPEFKRSTQGSSFDIGVMKAERRGFLGLKAPKPVVIVGAFEMDQEDPLGLEGAIENSMRESKALKPWFDVAKHPNVYRIAGTYTVEGSQVRIRLFVQAFDASSVRKNLQTVDIQGSKDDVPTLVARVRKETEERLTALEEAKRAPSP